MGNVFSGFTTDFKKGAFVTAGVFVALLILAAILGAFRR